MSEEKREILRMVADKVISVEEGERLLQAVEHVSRRSAGSDKDHRGTDSIHSVLDSVGAVMNNIGPIISDAVGEAVSGISELDLSFAKEYDEDLEEITPENGMFHIEPGTRLSIKNNRSNRAGGDIVLEAIEGDSCSVWCEEPEGLTIRKKGNRASIRWSRGLLKIGVPKNVSELRVSTLGGDISALKVDCLSALKTMGGDLRLTDLSGEFTAKTMGGSVCIVASSSMRGDSRAVTMGGDIDVSIPQGASLKVHAVTMGGTINTDETMGSRIEGNTLGRKKAQLKVGDGTPTGVLSVKTMGGSITLNGISHE